MILEEGGTVFTFTHRRASDSVSWGLDFIFPAGGSGLAVTDVREGGAIDSWNRMGAGGPSAGKQVTPGDKIVSANGESNSEAMVEEFRTKLLIKFVVERGDADVSCSCIQDADMFSIPGFPE